MTGALSSDDGEENLRNVDYPQGSTRHQRGQYRRHTTGNSTSSTSTPRITVLIRTLFLDKPQVPERRTMAFSNSAATPTPDISKRLHSSFPPPLVHNQPTRSSTSTTGAESFSMTCQACPSQSIPARNAISTPDPANLVIHGVRVLSNGITTRSRSRIRIRFARSTVQGILRRRFQVVILDRTLPLANGSRLATTGPQGMGPRGRISTGRVRR